MDALKRVSSLLLFLALASSALCSPGTEFWAVLSDEEISAGRGDLSILIGNPETATSASVVVATESGVVDAAIVLPLSAHVFSLGTARTVTGSAVARLAYRVSSDVPVHAYQYLEYSLDDNSSAAILLDRQAFGSEHLVLTQPGGDNWAPRTDFVTVVAPGPTRVTVVPTVATQAGPGVPALAAGTPFAVDLDAFDVLQIGAQGAGDLTGTSVTSTAPVEVFSVCVYCHMANSQGNGSGADHVQELMPPVAWWSTSVVAVPNNPLATDINIWRILAAEDSTLVNTDPPMPGTPTTIGRGKFVEFESTTGFLVSASRPVLVGRYNNDGLGPSCGDGCPDPALAVMTPPARFFQHAVFAMPTKAWAYNIIDVVAKPGTTVKVDGVVLGAAEFQPIGSTGYCHAQRLLGNATATHRIEADGPIAAYATEAESNTGASFPIDIASVANLAPACRAGGPYVLQCSGPVSELTLDGSGSTDPEAAPLAYRWSSPSPAVSFDDETSPTPKAMVAGVGSFQVDLEVDDGTSTVSCSTTLQIDGDPSTPPELSPISVPFLLAKGPGGVLFAWQDLGGAPLTYNLYEGSLGQIGTHAALKCNLAGSLHPPQRREHTAAVGPGSHYYLASASNCAAEGPTGMSEAKSSCLP